MRAALTAILLLALAAPAAAQQNKPTTPPRAVDQPDWTSAMVLTNPGVTYVVYTADSGSVPATIPWNVPITMTASAAAGCCFSMDPASTLGTASANTALILTDADGPDGPCAGWFMQRGETVTKTPVFDSIAVRPGARVGHCASPTTSPTVSGRNIHPPCDANADCTAAGAGSTCTTEPTEAARRAKSGTHIICKRAAAGAANTFVVTATGFVPAP